MAALKLAHLTEEQHLKLAELLSQAQQLLGETCKIVQRAPFTDEVLRVEKRLQENLIDPLSLAMEEIPGLYGKYHGKWPYPSVAVWVRG